MRRECSLSELFTIFWVLTLLSCSFRRAEGNDSFPQSFKREKVVERRSTWSGKMCCSNAVMPKCRQACSVANAMADLKMHCRQSDEFPLFTCIEQVHNVTECCSHGNSYDCWQVCNRAIEITRNNSTLEIIKNLDKSCDENVFECVSKTLGPSNSKSFEISSNSNLCCQHGASDQCRELCHESLNGQNLTENEMLKILEKKCGEVNPSTSFWACLMNEESHLMDQERHDDKVRMSIDGAKLHCCEKAIATTCRRHCFNSFNNGAQTELSHSIFRNCLNDNSEIELKRCLDEVDFPAELGCDGLSFCSNFNNRPKQLFRNCNAAADLAAHQEFKFWRQNSVFNLKGINIPIQNISTCLPDIWHTIACIVHLQPTTEDQHINSICWNDCFDILSKCLDWKLMNSSEVPSSICRKITQNVYSPCISIQNFVNASTNLKPSDNLKNEFFDKKLSCRDNICSSSSEFCEINRNTLKPKCTKGCPIGEGSNILVNIGEYVRVPSTVNKGCYKVCQCGDDGKMDNCHLMPCVAHKECRLGNQTIAHGASITVECNICSCFSEELTCTKKQCQILDMKELKFTTLPCNCPPHYVPVCVKNGKTYPSICLAKCVGASDADIEFGSCETKSNCDLNVCPEETVCFQRKNLCLSSSSKKCPQHECVPTIGGNCSKSQELVTDDHFVTHSSLCNLQESGRNLAFYGSFNRRDCELQGPVCGVNGETYLNECEALSEYSMVDYLGQCRTIGLIDVKHPCSNIQCTRNLPTGCSSFIPTGACCPVCGGALKLIFSRKQIDRGQNALESFGDDMLTLKSIFQALRKLIKSPSCILSGYLTIETDIFIIVHDISKQSNINRSEICRLEAVKISSLISFRSHHFTSSLGLSSIISVNIVPTIASRATKCNSELLILSLSLFLIKLNFL